MTAIPPRLFCCYIDQEGQEKLKALPEQTAENSAERHRQVAALACQENGEIFELRYGPRPDDYTHACRAHVGQMLDETETTTVWLAQAAVGNAEGAAFVEAFSRLDRTKWLIR